MGCGCDNKSKKKGCGCESSSSSSIKSESCGCAANDKKKVCKVCHVEKIKCQCVYVIFYKCVKCKTKSKSKCGCKKKHITKIKIKVCFKCEEEVCICEESSKTNQNSEYDDCNDCDKTMEITYIPQYNPPIIPNPCLQIQECQPKSERKYCEDGCVNLNYAVEKLYNSLKYISLWYNEHTGGLPVDKLACLGLFNSKTQAIFNGGMNIPGTVSVIGGTAIIAQLNLLIHYMQQTYPNTYLVYCKPEVSSTFGSFMTVNITSKLYNSSGSVVATFHSLGQYKVHCKPRVPTAVWVQFSVAPIMLQ